MSIEILRKRNNHIYDPPNFILKEGDAILVDFDGIIVEEKYPGVGPIKKDTYDFLEKCRINKVFVYIWSSRLNNHTEFQYKLGGQCGPRSLDTIKDFLETHNIYYSDFLLLPKPLSMECACYLLDDRATHNPKDFKFKGE